MGPHGIAVRRLIKANMPIMAQAQQLKVNPPQRPDHMVISGPLFLRVPGQPVGYMGILRLNVHMVEQVFLHKIAVALVVLRGQAIILIQVGRLYLGKGQLPILIPPYQLLIGTHRRGPGGQTQDTVRL